MKRFTGVLTLSLVMTATGLLAQQTSAATMPAGALSVKKFGARADGVANDLAAFQKAVAAVGYKGTLWVPAGKYLVDVSASNSIKLKSNMKFAMDPSAVILVKPNALTRYYVIDTAGASNVEVYGGQIIGDRNNHKGTSGEWGYGVRVEGGSYVNVHDMKLSNMWGDGACVDSASHVVLQRVLSTNNRRQGLSVGTGNDIKILDSEFSFTNGTAPMYGIDLEPDRVSLGNYLKGVLIQNCYFHDNKAGGIQPYKASLQVTIKNNRFENMPEGIYVIGSKGAVVSGNTFHGIKYDAIHLNSADSYQIYGNVFRKTSTSGPLLSITGLIGKATSYIIKSSATNLKVGTNQYGN